MLPIILQVLCLTVLEGSEPAGKDARVLVDTLEALLEPVEDFRCEFEGSIRITGRNANAFKGTLGQDGLLQSFSGIFVWKRGGDTLSDILCRQGADNSIMRQTLVVRISRHEAEQYFRNNDAPLGYSVLQKPSDVDSFQPNCLGRVFLLDKIKRDISNQSLENSIADGQIDGLSLKVLSVSLKDIPNALLAHYWIDLHRNGHVVRMESYHRGDDSKPAMNSRVDIELAPFMVGTTKVWMPVAGTGVGYGAQTDGKPYITKEPGAFETIKVVDGSMEFNKRPDPTAFTIKYKPGTPISDQLRKLTTEFGRQPIGSRPSIAEAKKMLDDQVAQASAQKQELAAVPLSWSFDWSWVLVAGMGVLVLGALGAWWNQNRRR